MTHNNGPVFVRKADNHFEYEPTTSARDLYTYMNNKTFKMEKRKKIK